MIYEGSDEQNFSTPRAEYERDVLQRVFGSQDGQAALDIILRSLGFFDMTPDGNESIIREAIARRNYACELLERMGVFHTQNTAEITRSLMAVEPKPRTLSQSERTRMEQGDIYE